MKKGKAKRQVPFHLFNQKISRRHAVGTVGKMAISAIVAGIIAGISGYLAGSRVPPIERTITKTVKETVTKTTGAATVTETTTLTKTVTKEVTSTLTTTSPAVTTTPEVRKLVFSSPPTAAGKVSEWYEDAVKKFNEMTGYEAKWVTLSDDETMIGLPLQWEAGTSTVDILVRPWPGWIYIQAKRGYLMNLADIVDVSIYPKSMLAPVTLDTGVYAIPYAWNCDPGFWFRKSTFEKYGLSKPGSYDEFLELLEFLKQKHLQGDFPEPPIAWMDTWGWPLTEITEHFLIYEGGVELNLGLAQAKVKWTDPRVVRTFDRLAELIEAGYFTAPADWMVQLKKFDEGKIPLVFLGAWSIGLHDPAVIDDMDFFPLPGITGLSGDMNYIFIPKYASNPKGAIDFLKYWLSKEIGLGVANVLGLFSTHPEIGAEAYKGLYREAGAIIVISLMLFLEVVSIIDRVVK